MLRTLLVLVLGPMLALVVTLALSRSQPRADFVLTLTEPRTLDPHRVSWLPEIQLAGAMFEGLTRLNPQTSQPEPAVAESWDVSADGCTYVFHLRPTVRWSTGAAVTADDFVFGWLRVLDPRCAAQYASLLFVVRGGEEYYRSRLNDDPADDVPAASVGVEALRPDELRVTLAGPCAYFLELTAFITFSPGHRPTLERWAYRDGRVLRATQHLWTRPGNIVCNGPFVLTRWDFKQAIRMERNAWYWDPGATGVGSIEALIASDRNAALIGYETGYVDLVYWLDRPVAEVLLREQAAGRRDDFHSGDRFATYFFRINCRRPPLDDPLMRRALSLAVDREKVCEHVMRLGESPAYTYVPRTTLQLMHRTASTGETIYYEPPAGLGAGLTEEARHELAREYLRRSAYAARAPRPIELAFAPGDPEQKAIAEAVQAMWEANLGLDVELRCVEATVLSTHIRQFDYDVVRSNWFGDYLDPSSFLEMFTTEGGQNRTGWSHAEYDRLIAAAARERDNVRRFEQYRAAERILCEEEIPIIPVFYRRGNYLLNPRFTGLYDNPRDLLPIHRVQRADGSRPSGTRFPIVIPAQAGIQAQVNACAASYTPEPPASHE